MDWNLNSGMEVGIHNQPSPGYSRHLHSDYTVGWVCALPREQSAASFMLDETHDPDELENPPHDSNSYICGSIGRHNVVIACLPMGLTGTVSAASVATRMVATFVNIKVGLMVGIGGGMPQKNVRLGDVVISCPKGKSPGVVQWDAGKAQSGGVFQRTGSLNKPPTAMLAALSNLESHAVESHAKVDGYMRCLQARNDVPKSFVSPSMLRDVLYQSSYRHVENPGIAGGDNFESQLNTNAIECALCDKTKTVKRVPKSRDIDFHYGLIASGDQVIKDAQVRNKLYDDLYKDLNAEVLCVEMEAAGLMNDFPCIVIRGICDYADSHKNDAWQDYAACVAAAYAKALLDTLPPTKVDEMKTIQDLLPPGFIEKARRFILPYLYSGQKSTDSVNCPTTNLEHSQLRDASHDQGHQPTTASPLSSQPVYDGEERVIKPQPHPEGIVSQILETSRRHVAVDDDLPKSPFLVLGKAATGAGNHLRLDQIFAPLTQNNGNSKDTPDSSSGGANIGRVGTGGSSGHAVGSKKKKGAIMKRLMMDTVDLIA